MGSKTSVLVDNPKESEMSDMRQGFRPESLTHEEVEIYSICCIEVRRVYKEVPLRRIQWEDLEVELRGQL